jgi:hypothetical protein
MPETPLDNEPLIPGPATEVDHKVNTAHARAVAVGMRQYVYLYGERVWITGKRPDTLPCIAVDPAGWAIWLAPDADEAELG